MIKNKRELLSKGFIEGRNVVLNIIEETLDKVNYYNIIKRIAKLEGNILKIDTLEIDLNNYDNIFLVGGGKNVSFMVLALEEILGNNISGGVVIEKKGCKQRTNKIPTIEGGHPLPDQESVKGAEKIIEIVSKAGEKDLLIVCVSGGWTALASSPPKEILFEDFKKIYDLLLKSGMPLEQMNIVRNHLSRLGKGKLPILTNNATVVGLIAVDEIGGLPWGPTVLDNTTFSDAIKVLEHYNLIGKIPTNVKKYFEEAISTEETPNEGGYNEKGVKVHNLVIANNIIMCEIARQEATKQGIESFILSTAIEGEARHVGTILASIANEIYNYGRPLKPPCILIAGGETTVTITGETGKGGRNQEMVLSTALKIAGKNKILISSIGTDGTDGPTDIAGAIAEGMTVDVAKKKGIDINEELKRHNSSYVFRKIGDAIFTYDTGTNLMDLTVIFIENLAE